MRHWRLLLGTLLLTSCGQFGLGTSENARPLTALQSQVTQLDLNDLQTLVKEKYQDIHWLQLQAYADLADFDLALEKDWQGLAQSVPYSKLLAARFRLSEQESALSEIQNGFYAQIHDTELPIETRLSAMNALLVTLPTPAQNQGAYAFTLARVHVRTQWLGKQLLMAQSKVQNAELQNGLEKAYRQIKATYGAFQGPQDNFADWKQALQKERTLGTNRDGLERIGKSLEHAGLELRLEFERLRSEGGSQATQFYPTPGVGGHITGEEFPGKVWALTFSAGPTGSVTGKLVDQLKLSNVTGTFFQSLGRADTHPKAVAALKTSGMELGAHAELDVDMPHAGQAERERQVLQVQKLAELYQRSPLRFFRLPHLVGMSNRELRTQLAGSGLILVGHNVDALDWIAQPVSDVVARVQKQMARTPRESGMIHFTETFGSNLEAVGQVIEHMKVRNQRLCGLGEIVDQMNAGQTVCPARISISALR